MNQSIIILFLCLGLPATLASYAAYEDVASMPEAGRSDMTATLFEGSLFASGNARIYLVGGCVTDQECPVNEYCFCPANTDLCQYYEPELDTWSNCAPAPRARYRHTAVNFNNKLYLFGGRTAEDAVITEVDVFTPTSNTWETENLYNWTDATSDLSSFTEGEDIFLVGGWSPFYTPMDTLSKYTPSTQTLTVLEAMPGGGRGDTAAASLVRNGDSRTSHFVLGGFGDSNCEPLTTVEEYNVETGVWTVHNDLLLGRGDMASGVIGDHLFAIAGETKDATCQADFSSPGVSIPVDDVERLTTDAQWVVEQGIPADRFRFVASSFERTIYLFGGQGILNTTTVPFPTHHVLSTTTRYVPQTIHNEDLSDGEIAGIAIAGIVVGAAVVLGVSSYFGYQKYNQFQSLEEEGSTTTQDNV